MSDFRPLNIQVEVTDEAQKKTEALVEDLSKDPVVTALLESHKIPFNVVLNKPWTMDSWRKDFLPCVKCKGLKYCNQAKQGYFDDLEYDGLLKRVMKPCKYMQEKMKKETHLQNYVVNDLPESMKQVFLADIDPDQMGTNYEEVYASCIEAVMDLNGLFLCGPMGTGKTYLAASACNTIARGYEDESGGHIKGKKVAFVVWPDFVQRMASYIAHDNGDETRLWIDRLKRVPFLVIDDIGAEAVTEWNRDSILFPILNARYDSQLPTWFTSNQDLKTLETHFSFSSKGKEEKLKAQRIMERIEMSVKVQTLTGKDRRKID